MRARFPGHGVVASRTLLVEHGSVAPKLIFAHGAGAPSSSAWMQRWALRLGQLGRVVTFDYPYMQRGSRRPDPLPRLMESHRDAIRAAIGPTDVPILIGKSMGSRVGCHVAAGEDALARSVKALVCFGYPLVGAGSRAPLRDQVLVALSTPILFVQGTRDKLCPLEKLGEVRTRMRAKSELFVVEGGDHSLAVGKRALAAGGLTQDDVDGRILEAIRAFLGRVTQ